MPDQQIAFRAEPSLTSALTAAADATGLSVSDVVRDALRQAYAPGVDDAQRAGIFASSAVRAGQQAADSARDRIGRAAARARVNYGPGSPYSLVKDVWRAVEEVDRDAEHRIAAFADQVADGTALAAFAQFAQHTGNTSAILPPGYAPIALVEDGDRPLANLATTLPLADSTPFTVPGLVTGTGRTAPHVELVNPTPATLAVAGGVVSPIGRSGVFSVSREVADAANPALDALALSVMTEDYIAKCEAAVAAELATLTPVGTTAAATIVADVSAQIGRMVAARRRRAVAAAVSAAPTIADALSAPPTADSTKKYGLDADSGDATATWRVQGCGINLSPDLGSTTGQLAAAVVAPGSLWAWESPTRTFRYDERSGPAQIDLALYGYYACRVLRPVGVRTLTLS